MRGRVVAKADVLKIVDLLRREYEVLAPFRGRGADSFFDVVTDANRDQVQIHVPNPNYPPKRYVLPHIERLMTAKVNAPAAPGETGSTGSPTAARDGTQELEINPVYDATKRAIFGIRSCDVFGIYHLDRFYLGREYQDVYYQKHRENLFLVNVVCSDPAVDVSDDCFCVCADTGPAAREHFDLQLMDLGEEFLAVAGTAKGEALFVDPIFKKASPGHVEKRRTILGEVRKRFKVATSWYSAMIKYISSGGISDETWEKIGNRCLECGGCSYICPTCTCFTVTERRVAPDEVERVRLWDSCALGGFTRMAGGHNPRKAVHDRRNRRFFRKLTHYFVQRELEQSCVGCGRCVGLCHGDIGMPNVVEMVRRETAGEKTN